MQTEYLGKNNCEHNMLCWLDGDRELLLKQAPLRYNLLRINIAQAMFQWKKKARTEWNVILHSDKKKNYLLLRCKVSLSCGWQKVKRSKPSSQSSVVLDTAIWGPAMVKR